MRVASRRRAARGGLLALALVVALLAGVARVARLPAGPVRADGPFAVVAQAAPAIRG